MKLISVLAVAMAGSAYGRLSESVAPAGVAAQHPAAGAPGSGAVQTNPQQPQSEAQSENLDLCAKPKPKSHSFAYKDVAGPPSEFAAMAQPEEASLSAYSGHFAAPFAMFAHGAAAAAGAATETTTMSFTQKVVVDSTSGFAIAAFVSDADVSFALADAAGKAIDLSKAMTQVSPSPPAGSIPSFCRQQRNALLSSAQRRTSPPRKCVDVMTKGKPIFKKKKKKGEPLPSSPSPSPSRVLLVGCTADSCARLSVHAREPMGGCASRGSRVAAYQACFERHLHTCRICLLAHALRSEVTHL